MEVRRVETTAAPAAIGSYAQATVAGGFVYTAGQIALDAVTGALVGDGDAGAEARQVLTNLTAVLAAAGAGWPDVLKTTIYLTDMADFAAVNDVYATFVGETPPARATVQVAALPRGARVEVDAVARVPSE